MKKSPFQKGFQKALSECFERLGNLLNEGISIEQFKLLHDDPDFQRACQIFSARVKNDNDARKACGLEDLNVYKDNPSDFVEQVDHALKYIGERAKRKSARKVMRKVENLPEEIELVFKNENFAIVSPEAACYSELAGHLDGSQASWCIASKGFRQHWKDYRVAVAFFVYAFNEDASWCIVVDNATALQIVRKKVDFNGYFVNQLETRENDSEGLRVRIERNLNDMCFKLGISRKAFFEIIEGYLKNFDENRFRCELDEDLGYFFENEFHNRSGNEYTIKDLETLLDAGADPNSLEGFTMGECSLTFTIKSDMPFEYKKQALDLLFNYGAVIDQGGLFDVFFDAIYDGLDTVKVLVEHHADINYESEEGMTPLMFAMKEGKADIVEYLLEKGADVWAGTYDYQDAVSFSKICPKYIQDIIMKYI